MNRQKRLPASRTLAAGLLATTMLVAPLVVAAEALANRAPVSVEQSQKPANFSAVIKAVRPAVVSIYVERSAEPIAFEGAPDLPNFGNGHPFNFFFKRFGRDLAPDGFGEGEKAPSNRHRMQGVGSGFFISADGYIVTNHHVIDQAKRITVRLDGGEKLEAQLVGADPKTDLALLKVAGDDFAYVRFADDGTTEIGQWVVTVGAPFGLGGSATAGIVSADGRDIGSGPYNDFIQIDAPINRGNSGGPAFNLEGQVIGVNTAILSPYGGNAGIGFAIPAKIAAAVIDDLRDDGKIERGWLGVRIQPLTKDLAKAFGIDEAKGALVSSVSDGAPADQAEIEAGDLIVAVDGKEIATVRDLARTIAAVGPEESVELTLLRNGDQLKKTVRLGQMPGEKLAKSAGEGAADADDEPRLGLALRDGDGNAVVAAVKPGSEADKKGLRAGTAILGVGSTKTTSAADVVSAVAEARKKGATVVLMQVETKLGRRFVALDLSGNA